MAIRKNARYWAAIESQEVNGPTWAHWVLRTKTTKKKATKKKAKKKK